jgi:hypothetical protein
VSEQRRVVRLGNRHEVGVFCALCRGPDSLDLESRSLSGPAEEENVAIRVLEFEATQAVVGVFQGFGERDLTRSEFGRQGVRIWDLKKCIPSGDPLLHLPCVIWHWSYTNSLEEDLRAAPPDDAEEDIVGSRSLEGDVKT